MSVSVRVCVCVCEEREEGAGAVESKALMIQRKYDHLLRTRFPTDEQKQQWTVDKTIIGHYEMLRNTM